MRECAKVYLSTGATGGDGKGLGEVSASFAKASTFANTATVDKTAARASRGTCLCPLNRGLRLFFISLALTISGINNIAHA